MNSRDIAIIGMSGIFPGAKNINELWSNMEKGVESIMMFPDEDLLASGVSSELLKNKNYVKAGTYIEEAETFDFLFFKITQREAELMDPQHRLFLEHSFNALADAGYIIQSEHTKVGVFASEFLNTYLLNNMYTNKKTINYDYNRFMNDTVMRLGNEKDYLATFVSYKLGFTGPSLTVQTSCSSSLVGIHYACQSLLNGESDLALAGGVSVRFPQKLGYLYSEDGILSPDGHIRTFDEDAKGMVFGNGLGVVVLKRLREAVEDNDNIYAVIKATTVNNDGSEKMGFTAPSVKGQSSVISETLALAEIDVETVTYVETHGTGTMLGDPIEIEGLTKAFKAFTDKTQFCAVGSIKTNIGHLSVASGVTGLMKICMMLKNKKIPGILNFQEPSHKIDFFNSPFYVNTRLLDWEAGEGPRRAGLSSLGMGGTNGFALIEEYLGETGERGKKEKHIISLSAASEYSLNKMKDELIKFLKEDPVNICDLAYSLGKRNVYQYGMTLEAESIDEIIKSLSAEKSGNIVYSNNEEDGRDITENQIQSKGKIIHLPEYPFERQRCWIEQESKPNNKDLNEGSKIENKIPEEEVLGWMHIPSWKRMEPAGDMQTEDYKGKKCLFFIDGSTFGESLGKKLVSQNADLFFVRRGTAFGENSSSDVTIGEIEENDYLLLVDALQKHSFIPEIIVNIWNMDLGCDGEKFDGLNARTETTCFYSLFNLAKALDYYKMSHSIKVVFITNRLYEVLGTERVNPIKSLIIGPLKVIPQEYSNISCCNIDLDLDDDKDLGKNVDRAAREIMQAIDPVAAFRNGYRWVECYEWIDVKNYGNEERAKNGGIYIIFGGLGSVGIQISEHMSKMVNSKIILIGRSKFPPKEDWELWLSEKAPGNEKVKNFLQKDLDNTVAYRTDITVDSPEEYIQKRMEWFKGKIKRIQNIQKTGSEVYTISADLSSEEQMRNAISKVKKLFGRIDGVIHSAVSSNNEAVRPLMRSTGRKEAENEFSSKVYGLVILEKILKNEDVDFVVIFSSLSSFLGGMGLVSYTSANAFADSFVRHVNKTSQKPWIVVNWDHWEDSEPKQGSKLYTSTEKYTMSKEQAYESFKAVLSKTPLSQIIICVGDLQERLDLWVNNVSKHRQASLKGGTDLLLTEGSTEDKLARIWEDAMGIENIDFDEVFFDIGGHSLLALQIITKIEAVFGCRIPLRRFLESPTVRNLARILEAELTPSNDVEMFIL